MILEKQLQKIEIEEKPDREKQLKEIMIKYQELNDKLDLIIERINKRKNTNQKAS